MTDANPFEDAEAWEADGGGKFIPAGDHVVTIIDQEDDTSKSGNPQVKVLLTDAKGREKTHWVTYHGEFLGKIVALTDSAGLERPKPGEFDPDDKFRLSEKYRKRLVGKKVGAILRDEKSLNDPTKVYSEVQGFKKPDEIVPREIPRDPSLTAPAARGGSSYPDDDIPF